MNKLQRKFRVIPSIDLMGGKVVRLVQGKPELLTFQSSDPVKIAEEWVKRGAKVLHVIDLDGSFHGKIKHEELIKEIASLAETQVGGGIRDVEVAERLLKYGVERVIFGTLAFEKAEIVRNFARENPGRVMIAIDSKGGKVAVKGWRNVTNLTPFMLAEKFIDLDVSFLFTDIEVEGLVSGIDRKKLLEVSKIGKQIYFAGGFSNIEEIRFAKKIGAAGVVLGSALYLGKINFEEALKIEEED
ncbi:MAG: 1-(5-phosphoribosyl)-5-[(5-phosphoribosylamino)methylideneamino]imidazole-4-carboxamide isomerase [Archaeoglobaceae archaeon]|nr:1-(5-phosphoribosyl)-5-[(5-phosphoribosylamino)methylideneamino]imidazole-4-carboxamide isomerase [Archaeoglobaceae archaeon]MCX8151853.1 1-(5-phosphoribosyl)-5-[(5-phosphoribosylamino)methylideneamino]imidazole-4-carboxamide isomerase [Archaeoglobaceae archaeon]MDW8014315.1 1-(5-phosphoribosyl)-5-[(5-phosphoribosylamino)methylideneamino]imidazole-4-carboxamide isomerase [Archaeoglobaceae archaeon]